jgi:hypothetical protein
MAETLSLMEFLQALLADAELRGDFGDDPQGTLAAHGLADLTPDDVHDALVLVQDNQTVDYSLDAITPAPPPPAGDDHEAAVEYLARYLDGTQQAGPDEQWTDPDAAPDAQFGGFGTGDDAWYGAGSGSPADDDAWAVEPDGAGYHAEPVEPAGYVFDEFEDFGDGDLLGDDLDGPDPGSDGSVLSEGT